MKVKPDVICPGKTADYAGGSMFPLQAPATISKTQRRREK